MSKFPQIPITEASDPERWVREAINHVIVAARHRITDEEIALAFERELQIHGYRTIVVAQKQSENK